MFRIFVLIVAIASPQSLGQPVLPSPLAPVDANDAIVYCSLDEVSLEAIRGFPQLRIGDFPTPAGLLELELTAFEVLGAHARVVIGGAGIAGEDLPIQRPDVVLLRGSVVGNPDSHVFLGLSPLGSNGWIRFGAQDEKQIIIASTQIEGVWTTAVYDPDALPDGAIQWAPFECVAMGQPPEQPPIAPTGIQENPTCRVVQVAIESDYEFTAAFPFNGNTSASTAYVHTLLGAVAEIYRRDFDVVLEVPFVRVWSANNDPYSANNISDRLTRFRSWWRSNMRHVERNSAQMLSGIRGGGLAWLGTLCETNNPYGIAGINGSFPYPLVNNHPQNWDVIVVSHELGHSFGARHTHELCPPIDQCAPSQYWGACQTRTTCSQGTIMSYCHLCSPGVSNIRLEFHDRTISSGVLPYLTRAICLTGSCTCYSDCDQSTGVGVLDVFDFLCFQDRFTNSQTYACDCDTSTRTGVCDVFDFLCFQSAFVGGCQ